MVVLKGGWFEEHTKMLEWCIGWGIRAKRLTESAPITANVTPGSQGKRKNVHSAVETDQAPAEKRSISQ
jgi:hypothetical protein